MPQQDRWIGTPDCCAHHGINIQKNTRASIQLGHHHPDLHLNITRIQKMKNYCLHKYNMKWTHQTHHRVPVYLKKSHWTCKKKKFIKKYKIIKKHNYCTKFFNKYK